MAAHPPHVVESMIQTPLCASGYRNLPQGFYPNLIEVDVPRSEHPAELLLPRPRFILKLDGCRRIASCQVNCKHTIFMRDRLRRSDSCHVPAAGHKKPKGLFQCNGEHRPVWRVWTQVDIDQISRS